MPNELESSSWPTTPSLYNAYLDKNSVVLYLGSHVVVVVFCGLCLFITVLFRSKREGRPASIARCRWARGMAAVAVRGRRESHSDLVAEPPKLRSIASPSDRQLHDACFFCSGVVGFTLGRSRVCHHGVGMVASVGPLSCMCSTATAVAVCS